MREKKPVPQGRPKIPQDSVLGDFEVLFRLKDTPDYRPGTFSAVPKLAAARMLAAARRD